MLTIQKLTKQENGMRLFLCIAENVSDEESAEIMAIAMSASWSPTTPEEGVYIYEADKGLVHSKFVNGIKVW